MTVFCSDYTNSVLGERIELLRNHNYKNIFVIGVFHGDETYGKYIIEDYIKKYPETTLIFIPCLNPDGMKKKQRTNGNKVDLNRNFPTKNWVLSEKDDYYGGVSSASEPETQFIIKMIEKYKPRAILSLHSPYKVVNYDGDAKILAEKISEITSYPVSEDIGYPTPGSFGTWAGIERNIPTITLELDEQDTVENEENYVFNVFEMLEDY